MSILRRGKTRGPAAPDRPDVVEADPWDFSDPARTGVLPDVDPAVRDAETVVLEPVAHDAPPFRPMESGVGSDPHWFDPSRLGRAAGAPSPPPPPGPTPGTAPDTQAEEPEGSGRRGRRVALVAAAGILAAALVAGGVAAAVAWSGSRADAAARDACETSAARVRGQRGRLADALERNADAARIGEKDLRADDAGLPDEYARLTAGASRAAKAEACPAGAGRDELERAADRNGRTAKRLASLRARIAAKARGLRAARETKRVDDAAARLDRSLKDARGLAASASGHAKDQTLVDDLSRLVAKASKLDRSKDADGLAAAADELDELSARVRDSVAEKTRDDENQQQQQQQQAAAPAPPASGGWTSGASGGAGGWSASGGAGAPASPSAPANPGGQSSSGGWAVPGAGDESGLTGRDPSL